MRKSLRVLLATVFLYAWLIVSLVVFAYCLAIGLSTWQIFYIFAALGIFMFDVFAGSMVAQKVIYWVEQNEAEMPEM